MKRNFFLSITLLTVCGAILKVSAQDTIELRPFTLLDTIVVKLASSYEQDLGSIRDESVPPMASLSELLQVRGGVSLKQYGPGLLATPTYRGGDANHTQVTWNGMTLNSPMLGTMDLSTVPLFQMDGVSLLSSVNSGLYTSGGMGSLIAMDQVAQYNTTEAHLLIGTSSFGNHNVATRVNFPLTMFSRPAAILLNADVQQMENNFSFKDPTLDENPIRVMRGASFSRSNNSFGFAVMPSDRWDVQVIYWQSQMDRSIPSSLIEPLDSAIQIDQAHRLIGVAKYQGDKTQVSVRSFYETNSNHYIDPSIGVDNDNRFEAWRNLVEMIHHSTQWHRWVVRAGFDRISGSSQNYAQVHQLNQINGLISNNINVLRRMIRVEGGVRFDHQLGLSAVLPFGGLRVSPFGEAMPLDLKLSGALTNRFPTLNERYWVPGGNDDLSPERGRTLEGGIEYASDRLTFQTAFYWNTYSDRIRWLPSGGLFSPVNIDFVKTSGVDINTSYTLELGQVYLDLGSAYRYCNAKGRDEQEDFYTLAFVPEHAFSAFGSVRIRSSTLRVDVQSMSQRFITNDEDAYLPAYHLVDIGWQQEVLRRGDNLLTLGCWTRNALDWQYQNMPWRPMPGRSIHLQIQWEWSD